MESPDSVTGVLCADVFKCAVPLKAQCPRCKGLETYVVPLRFRGKVPEDFPQDSKGITVKHVCIDCGQF